MQNQENVTEQKETVIPDNTPVAQEVQEQNTEPENPQDINWKKFRENREIERKQREEAMKKAAEKEAEAAALKAALDAVLNKPASNVPMQSSYMDDEETEEKKIDRIVEAKIKQREEAMERERLKREQAEVPQKLAQTFSDFNQVCSANNLDYLEFHHPEIAKPFQYMPDGFEKWASIYKAIKKLVPNTDLKKEQARLEKNMNKPQAMSVPGLTQSGDQAPIKLDEKRRAENWARMQKAQKTVR